MLQQKQGKKRSHEESSLDIETGGEKALPSEAPNANEVFEKSCDSFQLRQDIRKQAEHLCSLKKFDIETAETYLLDSMKELLERYSMTELKEFMGKKLGKIEEDLSSSTSSCEDLRVTKRARVDDDVEWTFSIFQMIPLPLWSALFYDHFVVIKDWKTLGNLRLTCKSFRNIISPFWLQVVPLHRVDDYTKKCTAQGFFPHNVQVSATRVSPYEMFKCLPPVQELRLDRNALDADLQYIPLGVKKLSLRNCNLTNYGMQFIPSSVTYLDLCGCHHIDLYGLRDLPVDIRLLLSDEEGETTLLNYAASQGNLDIVSCLLEKGAKVNEQNSKGETPLFLSAQNGHTRVIELLLNHGANPNQTVYENWLPLHIAAQNGPVKNVEILMKYSDINQRTGTNMTPLYISSQEGNLEVVQFLLSNSVDVHKSSSNNWIPLHIAAQEGMLDVVRELVTHRTDINRQTVNGMTPLYIAARDDQLEIVDFLIQSHADVNLGTFSEDEKSTPLLIACSYGHLEVVDLLLSGGADYNREVGKNKMTPLFMASSKGDEALVGKLLKLEVNVDVITIKDNHEMTPLYVAIKESLNPNPNSKYPNVIHLLKTHGSSLKLGLELAIKNDDTAMIQEFQRLLSR